MSYTPHDAFVAPARPKSDLWLTLVAFLTAVIVYAVGLGVTFFALDSIMSTQAYYALLDPQDGAAHPGSTLLLLATFAWMILGIALATVFVTKRSVWTLLGDLTRLRRDFEIAAIVTLVASLGFGALYFSVIDTRPNLTLGPWLMILPLAIPLILMQTGAEELVFRGFLQQQLAARFARPLIWMIAPSILFGFAHFDQASQGSNALAFVLATGVFGIIAADLTARTGSLGAAWGLHFSNNIMAILIVSQPDVLGAMALYNLTIQPDDPGLLPLILLDIATMGVVWSLIRRFLRR